MCKFDVDLYLRHSSPYFFLLTHTLPLLRLGLHISLFVPLPGTLFLQWHLHELVWMT